MAGITFDMVAQTVISIIGTFLTGSIIWGAQALIKRIDTLESTVASYAERLITLAVNEKVIQKDIQEIKAELDTKASREVVERIEERQEEIAKRQHHTSSEVTKIKLIQERCKACNS